MATGYIPSVANSTLDTLGTTYSWVKLHVGDPGVAAASNPAGNATRRQAVWSAATGGVLSNSAIIEWSDAEVTTAEDYTHWSMWTASTAGTCGFTGTMTANAVAAAGEAFRIAVGDLDYTLNVAA